MMQFCSGLLYIHVSTYVSILNRRIAPIAQNSGRPCVTTEWHGRPICNLFVFQKGLLVVESDTCQLIGLTSHLRTFYKLCRSSHLDRLLSVMSLFHLVSA
jgi:hypothetical protein